MDAQIHKTWSLSMVGYYSDIKRNEVLIYHSTTWMILESIMLSERSQTQRTIYCMIPFYELSRIDKSTETERLVVARGCEEGGI